MRAEPRIEAFRLWERTSHNGRRYPGYWGSLNIIAFIDEHAELRDGVLAIWQAYLQERRPPNNQRAPQPCRSASRARPGLSSAEGAASAAARTIGRERASP